MNEYTMALVNDLRVAERRLTKREMQIDALMAMVAEQELRNREWAKKNGSDADAILYCKDINRLFGWPDVKGDDDEG